MVSGGVRWRHQKEASGGVSWCQVVSGGVIKRWRQVVLGGFRWCYVVSVGVSWFQVVSGGVIKRWRLKNFTATFYRSTVERLIAGGK